MNSEVRAVDLDSAPMLAPPGPPAQLADPLLLLGRDPGRKRCGRWERSVRHASDARSLGVASRQRRTHSQTVDRETFGQAAA